MVTQDFVKFLIILGGEKELQEGKYKYYVNYPNVYL